MRSLIPAHRRHDISDKAWSLLEPHLPGREGVWGGVAEDNRLFVNAVFWIFEDGRAMAGFAAGSRGVEQHAPPFHPLERRGDLGKTAGNPD